MQQTPDPHDFIVRRGRHITLAVPEGLAWAEAPLEPATVIEHLWPEYRSQLHGITIDDDGLMLDGSLRHRYRIPDLTLPSDNDDIRRIIGNTVHRLSGHQLSATYITQQVQAIAYTKDIAGLWNIVSLRSAGDNIIALPVQIIP